SATVGVVAAVGLVAAIVLGGCAGAVMGRFEGVVPGGHDGLATALPVACAAVLVAVLCAGRGPVVRLLSGELLTEVGRLSYSLFLLHLPVFWLLRDGRPGLGPLPLFLAGGVVAWFLAMLVHYLLVERLATRPWRRSAGRDPADRVTNR
ncbi:hypothetical protein ABZ896_29435, partial [Streptomyces sp. NPDC047072]|uniref:hypothetical protein n=1 Tax=Streptomyces sp. NPDC047072 TaxID=3154809 RepID=UPI0033F7D404